MCSNCGVSVCLCDDEERKYSIPCVCAHALDSHACIHTYTHTPHTYKTSLPLRKQLRIHSCKQRHALLEQCLQSTSEQRPRTEDVHRLATRVVACVRETHVACVWSSAIELLAVVGSKTTNHRCDVLTVCVRSARVCASMLNGNQVLRGEQTEK